MPALWSGDADDFFADFRRWGDIERYLQHLRKSYPELVSLRNIGFSWEGRPLWVMEITNSSLSTSMKAVADRPTVVMQAGSHAREWIAPAVLLHIAAQILHSAGKDLESSGQVSELLRQFTIAIIPVVNPDGYVHSWNVNRMWRKTRSNHTTCSRYAGGGGGVDPNRNWDFQWGISDDFYVKKELLNPCSDMYQGPHAFSEPEVFAVAEYMRKLQMRSLFNSFQELPGGKITPGDGFVAAFLDYHSYGRLLLPPWAHKYHNPVSIDYSYQSGMTAAVAAAIRQASGKVYTPGTNLFFYNSPGTAPDWAYGVLGVRATMTIELDGSESDSAGFCLPASAIEIAGPEQFIGFLALVEYLQKNGAQPSDWIGTHRRNQSLAVSNLAASFRPAVASGAEIQYRVLPRKNGIAYMVAFGLGCWAMY